MSEAHEKTRIRQLEDAAAHWEHKYANAREYNRNLEQRNAALEARCRELEAALRQIVEKPSEDNEWDGVDKYRECQEIAAACFTKETASKPVGELTQCDGEDSYE